MRDPRQMTIYDVLDRRAEEERVAAQTIGTTRAVQCPGCGEWQGTDRRKTRQCGLCGRWFVPKTDSERA